MRAAQTRLRLKSVTPRGALAIRNATWDSASQRARLARWTGTEGSNSAIFGEASTVRRRAHDQVFKNPYAAAIVDGIARNVVGIGAQPKSTVTDEGLRDAIHELWRAWIADADADGIQSFYGLQALAVRAVVEGGEVFVRHRFRRSSDGLRVPYQLQLLEGEHCPHHLTRRRRGGNRIKGGIELDRIGRRVAYWLHPEHPGDAIGFEGSNTEVRVPAALVSHIFDQRRPGQMRGYSWLANVLVRLRDLDEYDDAELVRKKLAAMFVAFITSPQLDEAGGAIIPGIQDVPGEPGVAGATLQAGTMQELAPGEDVKFSEPADVGSSFAPFNKHHLRSMAVGTGITYDMISGDLTEVSFSSIRAGLNEVRRRWQMNQNNILIQQLCRPVWRHWMQQALLSGALSVPRGMTEDEVMGVKWIPQGWAYVNPQDEQNANKASVRGGFRSRQDVIRESGRDPDEVDREIAEDNERARANGDLVFDTNPAQVAQSGVEQASAAPEPAPAPPSAPRQEIA